MVERSVDAVTIIKLTRETSAIWRIDEKNFFKNWTERLKVLDWNGLLSSREGLKKKKI